MLTVSRLSITPVRSLALQHPESVEIGPRGVLDDRRFTLLTQDRRIFDATKFGPLVAVRAQLQQNPERLTITLPDGATIGAEVQLGAHIEAHIYGREFAAREVIGPWAAALSEYAGTQLTLIRSERRPDERDRNDVSIVSEASVQELSRQGNGGQPLDARRFRMLIQVAGARPHQEDEWLGGEVRIGPVVAKITRPDPRCVITTQDPETGLRDFPTLHAIKAYRGVRDGKAIDFGVYADVLVPGTVRIGDEISPDR